MLKKIFASYDSLQLLYGHPQLNAVYGGGKTNNPDICLIFMNPTARNKTCDKAWQGIRYPWLTTKQIWNFLNKCNLFDNKLNNIIQQKSPKDWDEKFCKEVYQEVTNKNLYITNLAKCSQIDARELDDNVFYQYLDLLKQELKIINPKKIVLFGNQVSSIVLGEKITVSTCRKQQFDLDIDGNTYPCYAVFYPVGNGRFNIDKSIEDLSYIAQEKDL